MPPPEIDATRIPRCSMVPAAAFAKPGQEVVADHLQSLVRQANIR
jgi:hypothetical protein